MYGWPLVSDGKIVQCVAGRSNWDNDYAGVRPSKSFELPLSSDVLYLFSRGRLSQGNVHIVHDADWRNPSSVKVDVSLHHASTEILDRISVCQLERQEGHSGVGIFVSPDSLFISGRVAERILFIDTPEMAVLV